MDGENLVYNLTRNELEKIIEPTVKKFNELNKYVIENFKKKQK